MGQSMAATEVVLKIAAKHAEAKGVSIFLKELAGMGLSAPPGLSGFTGAGRAKPSPVIRLFSYLTPKSDVEISIDIGGETILHMDERFPAADKAVRPNDPNTALGEVEIYLEDLAWGRSGDKGDKANIGIIARRPEYMDTLWSALTPHFVGEVMGHFMEDASEVERFYLPGSNAINFLMDRALGGGGAASLRNDAQAKGFAQVLLAQKIKVTKHIAEMANT